jgi:uncharacterized protein (TIGR03437 family)
MAPHGRKNPTLSLALVVAGLAAGLVPTTASLQTTALRRITLTPAHATNLNPAISGDGRRVVFETTADLAGAGTVPQFRTFSADLSTDPPAFGGIAGARAPAAAVSQDGSLVAFSSAEDLAGANSDRNSEIFLSDHGTLRQITNTSPGDPGARQRDGNSRPSISDDGRLVAFASNRDLAGANPDGNDEIFLFDSHTDSFRQLTDTAAPTRNADAKLSGDGSRVAFVRETHPQPPAETSPPRRALILYELTPGRERIVSEDAARLSLTPGRAISDDGRRVVFSAEDSRGASQVFLSDGRNGGAVRQLTQLGTRQADVPLHASVSGDGSRVTFATRRSVVGGNSDASVELYLYDIPTNRLSRLTDAPREATSEVVSSLDDEGASVAFNFPRALAGPLPSAEFADTSEIFLARPPDRPPHSAELRVIHAATHGREPSPEKVFAPGQIAHARGANLSLVTRQSGRLPGGDFPRSFSGVTITVNGRPARVFYVSPAQVNFQVPEETETGAAEVTVRNHDGYESRTFVQIAGAAPGIFTERADGAGAAVALDSFTQLRAPFDPVDAANNPRTLVLFATGVAGARTLSVSLGGRDAPVEAVVHSAELPGLDEIHIRLRHSLAGAGAARCVVTADGRESNTATIQFVGARRPARVTLAPEAAALGVGRTLKLAAKVFDAEGGEIAGTLVAFSSSDAGVAAVDADGVVRGAGAGAATITATVTTAAGGVSAASQLRVHPLALVINEVLADPPDGPAGDANRDGVRSASQDEFVEIVNASAADIDLGGYRIETRNSSGADVVRHLFAHGTILAPGTATVVFGGSEFPAFDPHDAAFGGALVMNASAGGLSLLNGGGAVTLRSPAGDVAEQFAYGEDPALAGDRNQSLTRAPDVTGDFAQHLSPTADAARPFSPGTRIGGTPFITTSPVARVEIAPATATVRIGERQQFSARAFDERGGELSGVIFRWESRDGAVAGVDHGGLATARAPGSTQIVARARNVASPPATLTVTPPPPRVVRVEVTPAEASINRGGTLSFGARAYDREGRIVGDAVFSWASGDAGVATVNGEGLAVGAAAGTTTITAATPDGAGGTVSAAARLDVRVPLVLNELLADVPPDNASTAAVEGDANRDGLRRPDDDEFVELLNTSDAPVDLSGLRVADATGVRFTFPAGTILAPGRAAIVFGGGSPPAADPAFGGALVFTASSLSLNDTGDTLTVKLPLGGADFLVLTQSYGTAGGPAAPQDQALARSPDAAAGAAGGEFIAHRAAPDAAGRAHSPGTRADGTPFGSPRLTRLDISPSEAGINVGEARAFTARAFSDRSGTEVEITNVSFAWDAGDQSNADVAPFAGPRAVATARAAGSLRVRASAGGLRAEAAITVRPPPPVLTRIEVSPPAASVVVGGTQQFTARAFDQFDAEMAGFRFSWATSDPSVAMIGEAGLATGVAEGSTEVRASAGALASRPATLTVAPPPRRVTRVELTPVAAASVNRGGELRFSARALDAKGEQVSGVRFDWTTSDAAVATVNAEGLARGVGAGTVFVRASTPDGAGGTAVASAPLEVRLPLVLNEFLADVPPDDTATAAVEGDANRDGVRGGGDDEFVEVLNASGTPVDLSGLRISDATTTRFTFPAGATLGAGRAAVVFGGGAAPADDPAFGGALIFRASSLSLNDAGDTISLKLPVGAVEFVAFTQSYGGAGGVPAPADQSLTRTPDSSVTAGAAGGFAPHLDAHNSSGRNFSPGTRADGTPFGSAALSRIEISPAAASLDIGAEQIFTARGYANVGGTEVEIQNVSFIWESSGTAKAALAPATGALAIVTAREAGGLTLRAKAGGILGEAALVVNPPPPALTRIEVSPETASVVAGGAQQFTARAFDQFGAEMYGVSFGWSSSDTAAATVDGFGLARGLRPGSAEIRASSGGVASRPATLTVTPPPRRITRVELSPAAAIINRGGSQRFSARAFDAEGLEVSDAPLSWSSGDAAVAAIDAAGLARGAGAGSVTIRVSTPDGAGGTVHASAAIEVRLPVVLSEFLADVPPDNPATVAAEGDANRDGLRNSGDDEFVEMVNVSDAPVDLSGLRLSDAAGLRFTFPAGSWLGARRPVIVFGGGAPDASDPAFGGALVLRAAALSLNDGGDTVSLKLTVGTGEYIVFSQSYGTAGGPAAPADQSLTHPSEPSAAGGVLSNFTPHLDAPNAAGRNFSPGTRPDGTPFGSAPVARIEIAPASATLDVGSAQTFTARAFADRDGVEVELTHTSFIWESGDATKASLAPANGLQTAATAHAAGTVAVRARAGGRDASATLTVNPPPPVLTRVELTPPSASLPAGESRRFTARAFDQYGAPFPVASLAFTSSEPAVASVVSQSFTPGRSEATATVTAHAAGSSRLIATAGDGERVVTSAPSVVSVEPSPEVPAAGQIVVNEALVSFAASATQQRADFVELHNTTDRTLDISGLVVSFRPSGAGNAPISIRLGGEVGSRTTLIAPRAYFLIANGPTTFGVSADFAVPGDGFNLNNTTGGIRIEIAAVKLDGLTYQQGRGTPVADVFKSFGEGAIFVHTGTSSSTNDFVRSPNAADTNDNSSDFKRNDTAASVTPKAANPTP